MKIYRVFSMALACIFSTMIVEGQETEKIKLSPGMLVRVWPKVNRDMQRVGNEPSAAGVIDLGADFSTERIGGIDPLSPSLSQRPAATEWSGYVRIEKEDTYVITITKKQNTFKSSTLHFFLKGTNVMDFSFEDSGVVEVKTKSLKLAAGYHPVSFLLVTTDGKASFNIKIRSASELDSDPLKVTDFYFRKK